MAAQGTGPTTTSQPGPKVKASFNMLQSDLDALREIAQWRGTSVTEALRGAIATEHYIREAANSGENILLEAPDGRLRQLVFR